MGMRKTIGAILLAYLFLALPLPVVLLDHELGLLVGNPAHTSLNDHAWLDHTAGSGMASADGEISPVDLVSFVVLPDCSSSESPHRQSPSVRGPPPLLS